ncbi:RAD55 family ATPase [Natrialbaceae archaeon A-CW2]
MTPDTETERPRCGFCRQPCPLERVDDVECVEAAAEGETDGDPFCSKACRTAYEEAGEGIAEANGHRKLTPGVAGLDASLPQGFPRNSFVLLVGNSGTREEAIQAELVWRALQRGEPAVLVAFTEPPTSLITNFLAMEWNVLPYLERGQLRIVDCFTSRMDNPERLYDRMTAWNTHLRQIVEPRTTTVRDPSDGNAVQNALDNCLEALEMVETGLVVVDSIAEFGSLVQPVQAYDFVKDVRAEVCKGRYVPIIAGATVAGERDTFPRDLDYVVDGVVDLALDGSVLEDTLFRRLRVRKLRGVLAISEWHTYEYTSGIGMVTFDPRAELEASAAEADSAPDDGVSGSATGEDVPGPGAHKVDDGGNG